MKKASIFFVAVCCVGIGGLAVKSKPVHASTQVEVSYTDYVKSYNTTGGLDLNETYGNGDDYPNFPSD